MTVATALTSRDPRHPTRLLKKKNMVSGYPLSRSDHSAHGEPGNRRSRRSGMGLGGKPHCSVRVANSLLVGPRPIAGPAGRAVRGPRTSGGTYSNARTGAGALDAAPARGARHTGSRGLIPARGPAYEFGATGHGQCCFRRAVAPHWTSCFSPALDLRAGRTPSCQGNRIKTGLGRDRLVISRAARLLRPRRAHPARRGNPPRSRKPAVEEAGARSHRQRLLCRP